MQAERIENIDNVNYTMDIFQSFCLDFEFYLLSILTKIDDPQDNIIYIKNKINQTVFEQKVY